MEAAHIYISGTDPDRNKQYHAFLAVMHGPPLCAICRLDREQHLEAENDDPRIQAPSVSDQDEEEASPQRRLISMGRSDRLFRNLSIKEPECKICLDEIPQGSSYTL